MFQFMLSVTVIVHQPSGVTLESPYIVISSRGLPILAKSRRVSMLHVAVEIPGFLTLPFATVIVAIIFRSYFVTCMQFVDTSDE